MTISVFSDELAQVRTKKKEFLTQIERIVPWKEWLELIQPCYYKGERGNKPYPLEIMLRLYLLQNLYDLILGLVLKMLKRPNSDFFSIWTAQYFLEIRRDSCVKTT